MIYYGIDTAARITAVQAEKVKAEELTFVVRYLVPASMGKEITADEATALRNAGVAVMLCWETTASRAKAGGDAGASDGKKARELARELGVPDGTAIYFAVDYDAPRWDFEAIRAYLIAAKAAVYPYQAGVYGSKKVLDAMCVEVPGLLGWQCVAWSYGAVSEHMDVYQYQWQGGSEAKALAAKLGFAVDLDRAESLDGMWKPEAKKPWYADTIAWAVKEGIMDGTRPDDYATRAEVAQMIRNYNRRFESDDGKAHSGLLED